MNAKLRERLARALASSQARDDEGEYERLADLIGFSGENKLWTALGAAVDAILTELEAAGYVVASKNDIDRLYHRLKPLPDDTDADNKRDKRHAFAIVKAMLKSRPTL